METWTRLFSSIVTSSIWAEEKETKIVWVTMLALKDSEGKVEGSIPGLAQVAGVTKEECAKAIAILEGPDEYSRTKENDGRRIKRVERGWVVLNHIKYRDEIGMTDTKRAYWASAKAKQREEERRKKAMAAERRRHKAAVDAGAAHPYEHGDVKGKSEKLEDTPSDL